MYSRHDLVWLSAAGWDQVRAAVLADQHAIIGQWQQQDWPAIVRRAEPGIGDDGLCLCLGIAVAPDPSNGLKQKIAIRANTADVRARRAPLALRDAIPAAPPAWRAALSAIDTALPGLRVYGSLALQKLTGQPYVTTNSDIDLLFAPASEAALRAGLAVLTAHAVSLPLDGEIVFPSADAVSWKEWLAAETAGSRVLVKAHHAVRLASCATLLASFER